MSKPSTERTHVVFVEASARWQNWLDMHDVPVKSLIDSMLVDQVGRWSEDPSLLVTLVCGTVTPDLANVRRFSDSKAGLPMEIRACIHDMFEVNDTARVVIMLGRNPLLEPKHIAGGIAVLGHEEEVVVLGESEYDAKRGIMWVGMNRFVPGLLDDGVSWWLDASMVHRVLSKTQSLVFSTRTVREVASLADLAYLRHEISRRKLLREWYPAHTDALLASEHRHPTTPLT